MEFLKESNMKNKIFFTSDTHFSHKNIIEYEASSRPFSTIEEMNEVLIDNWNNAVKDGDLVFILGDMFMGGFETIDEIMPRLNGRKILVRGNHDTDARVEKMKPYLKGVYDILNIWLDNKMFVLCHYPIREWNKKHQGAYHLYGHVHSNENKYGITPEQGSYNVGVDTNGLKPLSLDEIMIKLNAEVCV